MPPFRTLSSKHTFSRSREMNILHNINQFIEETEYTTILSNPNLIISMKESLSKALINDSRLSTLETRRTVKDMTDLCYFVIDRVQVILFYGKTTKTVLVFLVDKFGHYLGGDIIRETALEMTVGLGDQLSTISNDDMKMLLEEYAKVSMRDAVDPNVLVKNEMEKQRLANEEPASNFNLFCCKFKMAIVAQVKQAFMKHRAMEDAKNQNIEEKQRSQALIENVRKARYTAAVAEVTSTGENESSGDLASATETFIRNHRHSDYSDDDDEQCQDGRLSPLPPLSRLRSNRTMGRENGYDEEMEEEEEDCEIEVVRNFDMSDTETVIEAVDTDATMTTTSENEMPRVMATKLLTTNNEEEDIKYCKNKLLASALLQNKDNTLLESSELLMENEKEEEYEEDNEALYYREYIDDGSTVASSDKPLELLATNKVDLLTETTSLQIGNVQLESTEPPTKIEENSLPIASILQINKELSELPTTNNNDGLDIDINYSRKYEDSGRSTDAGGNNPPATSNMQSSDTILPLAKTEEEPLSSMENAILELEPLPSPNKLPVDTKE